MWKMKKCTAFYKLWRQICFENEINCVFNKSKNEVVEE